jgi:hypothetical protein
MVNENAGDIQIVGRTCEQIIRDALNKYGLPETNSGMGEYTFPATSATGVLTSEVFARFFDLMIQSERDYPYGVPDYKLDTGYAE